MFKYIVTSELLHDVKVEDVYFSKACCPTWDWSGGVIRARGEAEGEQPTQRLLTLLQTEAHAQRTQSGPPRAQQQRAQQQREAAFAPLYLLKTSFSTTSVASCLSLRVQWGRDRVHRER